MESILVKKQGGPDHIYSVHEPDMRCIGSGKDQKQYEFCTKVSIGNPRLAREGIAVVTPANLKRATNGTPA